LPVLRVHPALSVLQAVVDGLHERLGLRREDVFSNLVEVVKENWSFGNGVAQYVS
jgi:4-oxalocrotonate tautomerase